MSSKQAQTLTADDYISVVVVGTNGSKKKTVRELFNGLGQSINDAGEPLGGGVIALPGLPTGTSESTAVPQLSDVEAQYNAAQSKGDWVKAAGILAAFQERVQAAQAVAEFPTIEAAIRDAVVTRCMKVHGFVPSDQGAGTFVLTPSEIDCTTLTLKNGRTLYRFSAAAVFGA